MSSKENEKSEDVNNISEAVKNIKASSHMLVTAGAGVRRIRDCGVQGHRKGRGLRKDERRLRRFVRETSWIRGSGCVLRFWGSCFNSYRKTEPHRGYGILKRWRDLEGSDNVFVYTLNVDRHFLRAGFPENYVC